MADTDLAIPTKEVEEEARSIAPISEHALSLTIESPEQVKEGEELLTKIKEAKKQLTARKEAITRPAMAALASIRDLFKGPETVLAEAEKIVKGKMLEYNALEEERIETEKAKAASALAAGTIKEGTAVAKTLAAGVATKMKTRTLTKVRVTDESLLPREYLVPDLKLITKAIIDEGKEVPGAESYKEKVLAS